MRQQSLGHASLGATLGWGLGLITVGLALCLFGVAMIANFRNVAVRAIKAVLISRSCMTIASSSRPADR